MAGGPTPGPSLPDRVPREVLNEYQKLLAHQKQEKAELQKRIDAGTAALFEKHTNEQRQFWTSHPHDNTNHEIQFNPSATLSQNTNVLQAQNRRPGSAVVQYGGQPTSGPILQRKPQQSNGDGVIQSTPQFGRNGIHVSQAFAKDSTQSANRSGSHFNAAASQQQTMKPVATLSNPPTAVKPGARPDNGHKRKPRPPQRHPEVIVLSDDDEPKSTSKPKAATESEVCTSLPSASLEFFGGKARGFAVGRQLLLLPLTPY